MSWSGHLIPEARSTRRQLPTANTTPVATKHMLRTTSPELHLPPFHLSESNVGTTLRGLAQFLTSFCCCCPTNSQHMEHLRPLPETPSCHPITCSSHSTSSTSVRHRDDRLVRRPSSGSLVHTDASFSIGRGIVHFNNPALHAGYFAALLPTSDDWLLLGPSRYLDAPDSLNPPS